MELLRPNMIAYILSRLVCAPFADNRKLGYTVGMVSLSI